MTSKYVTALALAALLAGVGQPAEAARRRDRIAPIVRIARRQFRAETRAAERLFAGVAADLTASVRRGTVTPKAAVATFGPALATYVANLKRLSEEAAAAVASDASDEIADARDPRLRGAAAGDGGSLDRFGEQIQADLDRLRRRAIARTRRLQAVARGKGGTLVAVNAVFGHWTFSRRAAPTETGPATASGVTAQLWAVVVARGADFSVSITAAGVASPDASGRFDLRMSGATGEIALDEFMGYAGQLEEDLGDAGMAVDEDGAWAATVVLEPGQDAGNRTLSFGVDPEFAGLAGWQPRRRLHAGTVAIP